MQSARQASQATAALCEDHTLATASDRATEPGSDTNQHATYLALSCLSCGDSGVGQLPLPLLSMLARGPCRLDMAVGLSGGGCFAAAKSLLLSVLAAVLKPLRP